MSSPQKDPVTLWLPDAVLQQACELASITNRTVHDILIEWLHFASKHQQSDDFVRHIAAERIKSEAMEIDPKSAELDASAS